MKEYFFRLCVILLLLIVVIGAWQVIRPGVRIRPRPETVAAFNTPHRAIGILQEYAQQHGIPFAELFAVFNAENDFFPEQSDTFDLNVLEVLYVQDFYRLMRRYNMRSLTPYIDMYNHLFSEIETFPIPSGWYAHDASVMFGNSWGVSHNFQGNRMHMGTAIVDRENMRGRVPVVSMTHGEVAAAGWDNNLGYFVGITTINGTNFLYAHLDSIAQGIAAGQIVAAGEPLGQMGASGGGRSNRTFPVHLHLGISPQVDFVRGDFWINPYPILRYLE